MRQLRKLKPRVTGPGRMLTLAKPPSWSAKAKCLGNSEPYDAQVPLPSGDERARDLCAGCPVIAECLNDAMETEGSLNARNRYGIRGGLTPTGRANLALQEGDEQCPKGHSLAEVGVYVAGTTGYERCRKCVSDRDNRRPKKKVA